MIEKTGSVLEKTAKLTALVGLFTINAISSVIAAAFNELEQQTDKLLEKL